MTQQPAASTQTKPVAVFMMGGPAAGKSVVRKAEYGDLLAVDCDDIKAEMPGYDPRNPSACHAESAVEASRRFYAALGTGQSVVYDGTGCATEKYAAFIRAAAQAGYETVLVYVQIDLQTALARNAARERVVPEAIVRERHAFVDEAFGLLRGLVERTRIVVNN